MHPPDHNYIAFAQRRDSYNTAVLFKVLRLSSWCSQRPFESSRVGPTNVTLKPPKPRANNHCTGELY